MVKKNPNFFFWEAYLEQSPVWFLRFLPLFLGVELFAALERRWAGLVMTWAYSHLLVMGHWPM